MAAPADETNVDRLTAVVERQRRQLEAVRSQAATRSVVDLAKGTLMERLGLSPAEAEAELSRLAEKSGTGMAVLAAQVTGQPGSALRPGPPVTGGADAMTELAPDGAGIAAALLEEALSRTGAAAVALWLAEPDGGLALAGQAGFDTRIARQWRYIPAVMDALCQRTARTGREVLWPDGRPDSDATPLIGDWPSGARAVLPMLDTGLTVGVMEISWPRPLPGFPAALRRELAALAEVARKSLASGQADGHGSSGVLGLLDSLADSVIVASAIRDRPGAVTDFRIEHLGPRFADPAGRGHEHLAGRRLLEVYPAAALVGGLYDRAVEALASGKPQQLAGEVTTGPTAPVMDVRVARLFDGVVITWRRSGEAERLTALLEHVQRLGRIGAWEEDLPTGQATWTDAAAALFGEPPGSAIPLGAMDDRVPGEDLPALETFRDALLREKRPAAAVLRVNRADSSARQLRAFAEPVTDPAGRVIAVRGAFQDVSAAYHTQVAFAAARDQLAETEQRVEEEHRLALRLQEAITPRSARPLKAAGIDVAARYRPALANTLVGGDWYDTTLLPNGEMLLVVGDVAGHGIDAVNGMVTLRNSLRGLAITGEGADVLLGWLNNVACHLSDGLMGTVVCGRYEPASRVLRWARAGHLPPILIRDGTASELSAPPGLMIGVDTAAAYQEVKTTLQPGDVVLLYTDGLIERRYEQIDHSQQALLAVAGRPVHSVGRYADYLLDHSPSDVGDDTCLVAVRVPLARAHRASSRAPAG